MDPLPPHTSPHRESSRFLLATHLSSLLTAAIVCGGTARSRARGRASHVKTCPSASSRALPQPQRVPIDLLRAPTSPQPWKAWLQLPPT
eukprot:7391864-Prymnesium_polylepis.2